MPTMDPMPRKDDRMAVSTDLCLGKFTVTPRDD